MRNITTIIALLLYFSSCAQMTTLTKTQILSTHQRHVTPASFFTAATINATGESTTMIGIMTLQSGPGTSKVLSAAGGGKIRVRWNTVTAWASASTNVRIGLQDVGANGIEDGTFDVYADLVPGTESVVSSTATSYTMESGTKTVSYGDLVALSIEMTNRGAADDIQVGAQANSNTIGGINFPYITNDGGGGPTKSNAFSGGMLGVIEFDDGTLGWLSYGVWQQGITATTNVTAFNTGTTPDEYAVLFKPDCKMTMDAVGVFVGSIASTDNFEVIFYTDPLGTPVASETVNYDPDFTGSGSNTGAALYVRWTSEKVLLPNVWYAIGIRPTTANSVTTMYYDLTSGFTNYKAGGDFGTNCKLATRTNQTGSFTETQTYHVPLLYVYVTKLDAGRKERSSSF